MTSIKTSIEESTFHVMALGHVNVTVPEHLEAAAKSFYGNALGLKEISKPAGPRQTIGAWYQLGDVQLHLSVAEEGSAGNSDRHVCYLVRDIAAAKQHLRQSGVEIIPDPRPVARNNRFYIRDPGGNLIEIAQVGNGFAG